MARNKNPKPQPMLYYDIEVSRNTYDAIIVAAKLTRAILTGDLSMVVDSALMAYRERTGNDAPADVEHNIRECARGLAAWGWNRPVEKPEENITACVYHDIENVLMLQDGILRGEPMPEAIEHHAPFVPLPRVRCAYQSTQARVKQLRVLTPAITNRKPR